VTTNEPSSPPWLSSSNSRTSARVDQAEPAGRSPDPGPIIAGRPLPWLALQGLAAAVVVAAIATALAWRRAGADLPTGERARLGLLLTAGAVFLPWAFYWGLLLP
jgi:hypothetical protein